MIECSRQQSIKCQVGPSASPVIYADFQFRDQICVGIGTAFLVAPNKLLTAGHLIKDIKNCVILFDYEWNSELKQLRKQKYHESEIFKSVKVIRKCDSKRGDFALLEIDKIVANRPYLELATYTKMAKEIKMISCPDGTPLKLTNKGVVWEKAPKLERLSRKGFFLHNLDNSGGSSGAPIFDSRTGKVIGIQSGGDENYVEKKGIIYQVRGDETGKNTNIGRNLSGEYGSKIPVNLNKKIFKE